MSNPSPVVCTYGGPLLTDIRYRRQWNYETAVLAHHHLPRFQNGKVQGLVVPVISFEEAALLLTEIRESNGALMLTRMPDEVKAAAAEGSFAVLPSVSFEAIGTSLEFLDLYNLLGVCMFHLALNPRNLYVDGVGEDSPGGLSTLGRQLVERLTALNILVDVSHTSDRGVWDVLEIVKGPVLASHSNARAVCNNPRNLSDELAKAIVQQGGLIALSTYPTLIANTEVVLLEQYLDHMDYFAGLVGTDAIAVGADFIDYVYELVMPKIRTTDPTKVLYGDKVLTTQNLASIQDIYRIAEGLARRGYNDETIAKIMGGNFMRVWRQVRSKSSAF